MWQAIEYHGGQPFSYAVKIIDIVDGDRAGQGLDELRLQAALATQLEHPALVKVKEVFVGAPPHAAGAAGETTGRRLYFVMKWIEGRSLQEALEGGQISGLGVLAPLEPIAEAIDYLHSGRDTSGSTVLHRDIKPANVLLADDGRVYLVDFGLVRFHSTAATSRIFGTAPFMAPESLARGEYTPATDRYTLGATVYYALTGEMPIPGDTAGMGQRLATVLGPGHDRVAGGILQMLSVQADARPASAATWLRALRTAPPETTAGLPAGFPPGVPPIPPTSMGRPPLTPPPGYGPPPSSSPHLTPPPPSFGPGPGPSPSFGPGPGPSPSFGPGPGPSLGNAAAGYFGGPAPAGKSSSRKVIAWIAAGMAIAVLGLCCLSRVSTLFDLTGSSSDGTYGSSDKGKGTEAPVDHSVPPPAVTALEPVLVSVGDIAAAMKIKESGVYASSDSRALHGGLTKLALCAEKSVNSSAIGAHTANSFYTSGSGYPYVSSSVAGFYGTAAAPFFASVKTTAERCGWKQFTVPKLGEESFAVYNAGDRTEGAIFFRQGQVIVQVAVSSSSSSYGSYQSDLTKIATAMSGRLPK